MKEKKKFLKFNIIAIIAITIFCVAIAPITLQNDTYYTIKIGEYVLQNGIDMQDPFSWHEDLPYTYPHWAYDVCIYLIYAGFGMAGIYVSTCILSVILGLAVYGVNCKVAKNHLLSFFITLGAIYLVKDYITARAQLVTFILFVLTIYFIEKFLETKKKRYATCLIIIPIIIANMHAAVWPFYFILFLPYIAEYLVALITDVIMDRKFAIFKIKTQIKRLSKNPGNEDKIRELKNELELLNVKIEKAKAKRAKSKENPYKIRIERNNNTKWLIVIMLVCALTGLLTPQDTYEPYTHVFKLISGNTTQNINEHLPMTLIDHDEILCLIVLYIALLTFTKIKINLRDLCMLGGLAFLMLLSRRQLTMFALIGSIILNKLTFEALCVYMKDAEPKLVKAITTKVGAFVVLGLVLASGIYFMKDKEGDEYIDSSTYPVAACDWILENLDVENIKIYNEYNYGSYLIYRNIPVFIDSRCDLYSPEFNTKTGKASDGEDIFMDFINVSSIGTYYEYIFDNYGMTHVLTGKNSKIAMLINNRTDTKYTKLYEDDHFVIYEIN